VLLEAILSRVLVPGERLLIDEIAEHFGISKIPVREAIKALEASGWHDAQPRRGTYVRPLSEEELKEVFEMRRVLEPYAARKAAERRTAAQLAELKELVTAGNDAIKRKDVVETSRVNSRFHSVIAEAVGNAILCDSLKDLQSRIRRYFVDIDWKTRGESFSEHKNIYEAIRDQDADRAERLTNAHVGHTEDLAARTVMSTKGRKSR
jgi:DNA-binding GntR family transcriptional regulator